ncbi:MAG TPA: glutamate--tRNA ligase [Dehalococcoidia bacterium]|nr:glutamate--tRNA ligase [Dehalococcoidia bacterium]
MRPVVRTRFAPSPTGDPHVGNIRTALFAWLFARHNSGSFILRIEDTDVARRVEGAVEALMGSLRWLGLDWDEGPDIGGDYGPYVQSERLGLYEEAARRLVEQGDAYYCYCSPERLEEIRAEQLRRKQPPGYDRQCRELSEEERKKKENEGITPVVRFKVPLEGQTRFSDVVWGEVKFENNTLDDLVLLKSDGYPTYNLANIVDDHKMEISHVIRGEEFISTTPHHVLLYKALGYEPPQFAHLPRLTGTDRSKLSKRHGAVSIGEFRKQGYLPEAMVNFLALLGWSLDDKTELMTRQELIASFTLERVKKTAASFNPEKLDWMNGVYIRSLAPEDFLQRSLQFLERDLPSEVMPPLSVDYIKQIMPLVQERVKTLADVPELTRFFFVDRLEYDTELLITKGMTVESTRHALGVARQRLAELPAFDAESLEEMLRPLAAEMELKTGQLFGTLRTAVTGQTAAPPLFQTMAVLGRETCLERIDRALDRL